MPDENQSDLVESSDSDAPADNSVDSALIKNYFDGGRLDRDEIEIRKREQAEIDMQRRKRLIEKNKGR